MISNVKNAFIMKNQKSRFSVNILPIKMIGVQSCKHFGCQRSQMPNVAPFGCRGNMELGGLTFS